MCSSDLLMLMLSVWLYGPVMMMSVMPSLSMGVLCVVPSFSVIISMLPLVTGVASFGPYVSMVIS